MLEGLDGAEKKRKNPAREGKSESSFAQAKKRIGAGFVTKARLAAYLRMSPRGLVDAVAAKGLRPNRAGRFGWENIWAQLWQIHDVPAEFFDEMKQPVLPDADIVEILGVTPRSLVRDLRRPIPLYELPDFLTLKEKVHRHHPMRIFAWQYGIEPEPWLAPVRRAPRTATGLKPRVNAVQQGPKA